MGQLERGSCSSLGVRSRHLVSCRSGTYGAVKAMTPEELQALGVEIVVANTLHPHVAAG